MIGAVVNSQAGEMSNCVMCDGDMGPERGGRQDVCTHAGRCCRHNASCAVRSMPSRRCVVATVRGLRERDLE